MSLTRILVTASTFPVKENDSCPRFILDLCKSINDVGIFECLVLAPHSEGAKRDEIIEDVKVHRYIYILPSKFETISGQGILSKIKQNKFLFILVPLFLFSQLISTLIFIRKFKPDILLVNWIIPQGIVGLIAKILYPKLKIVLICHGGDVALINSNSVFKIIGRYIVRISSKIVAVSSFIANQLKQFTDKDVDVISMGVDINKFFKIKSHRENNVINSTNIVFIGRLVEKKGCGYLIDAIELVSKYIPQVKLTIIGDGPLRGILEEMATDKSYEIVFTGALSHTEMQVYLEDALVLVAPSINERDDYEGLPTVLLEAMSAKVPIISTDAGGIKELILSGVNGILVEQRNHEQIAYSIVKLMQDSKLRNALVQQGYNTILNEYSYAIIGKKYSKLLSEVHSSES